MTSYHVQRCNRCHASTVWADTLNATRIQLDALPAPAGTYALAPRPGRDPLAELVPVAGQPGRDDLHRTHYMTCNPGTRRPAPAPPAPGRWGR